jgi:multidrug efflux pump subunit AcrA (membrane-fusion protein)
MNLGELDLREEFFGDVYMMKPSWWMRWGVTVFLGIFILLFFLAYIVRYPDIIKCEIRISTTKPSITFQLPEDAEIQKILVNNNAAVKQNTNLLVFRNSANYKDVLALDKAIVNFSYDDDKLTAFFEKYVGANMQLGETIEGEWTSFSNELLLYYKIRKMNSFQSQIKYLDDEVDGLKRLQTHYSTLLQIDDKQNEINEEKMKIDSILSSQKVLSRVDNYTNRQNYYSKLSELKQNQIQVTRIGAEIVKLMNNKKSLMSNEKQSLLTQSVSIRTSLGRLHAAIEAWKKRCLFVAPFQGKVHFLQNLEEGNIFAGKLLTVLPDSTSHFIKANISVEGAGKVRVGQRVLIKLNDYPYKEYGVIEGKLSEFSLISDEKFYVGRIDFKYPDIAKHKISIKDNMRGIGEIITNDRSLLERVFSNILYVFNKK